MDRKMRRGMLDELAALNHKDHETYADPEIDARIAQYEMAFRMQSSVPDLIDVSKEPAHILEMYGPDAQDPVPMQRTACWHVAWRSAMCVAFNRSTWVGITTVGCPMRSRASAATPTKQPPP